MIAPKRTALILLAAGRSVRFGTDDKLTQDLHGRPLALHAVVALAEVPFLTCIAVISGTTLDFAAHGYTVVRNDRPEDGISGSVKLGVAAARDAGAEAVLIALADMPRITTAHILRLLQAADSLDAVIASTDGTKPSPPAVFGAARFEALLSLEGDEGARTLIASGKHIRIPPEQLIDIDRTDDLERARG